MNRNKAFDFRPVAEPGWRVQHVIIENGPVAMTFGLAGWLLTTTGILPAYWDQTVVDSPSITSAVTNEESGRLYWVLAPGEPELTSEELEREISQLETNWAGENVLWRQLGISYRDGLALKEAGLSVFEEWLALPRWERVEGFAAWWDEYEGAPESA